MGRLDKRDPTHDVRAQIYRELDLRLSAHDNIHQAINEALKTRDESINARLGLLNEFRGTLSDQATHFLSRHEIAQLHATTDQRIEALTRRIAALEQKGSNYEGRFISAGAIVSIIVVAATIIFGFIGFVGRG